MKFTTPVFAATALSAGVLLALTSPLAASAHIAVDAPTTAAGAFTVLTFALPHGCDASSTTTVSIGLPDSIASVTPTANAGWAASETLVDLATPIDDGLGNTITTRTGAVLYAADTPFPDGLRTTFALSLQIPADAEGDTLEFPVLQTCEVGETNWNETAVEGEDEPAHPAPAITVTAATGDEHGHSDSAVDADATHDEAAATTTTATASDDVLARVLGAGGVVVGAVGIALAVSARRKQSV
jgi:uncharacterized protein YcnI